MDEQTINFAGEDLPVVGISNDRRRIITPRVTLELRPLCTACGVPFEEGYRQKAKLPRAAPTKIVLCSFRIPDWTDNYADDFAAVRCDILAEIEGRTVADCLALHTFTPPKDGTVEQEIARWKQHERNVVLSEAWKHGRGREIIFERHATAEERVAVEPPVSLRIAISSHFKCHDGADLTAVRERIKYEVHYNDKAQTVIYLEDVNRSPLTASEAKRVANWRGTQPQATTISAAAEKIAAVAVEKVSAKVDRLAAKHSRAENPTVESSRITEGLLWTVQREIEKVLEPSYRTQPGANAIFSAYCRDRMKIADIARKLRCDEKLVDRRVADLKEFLHEKYGLTLDAFCVDTAIWQAAEREGRRAHRNNVTISGHDLAE